MNRICSVECCDRTTHSKGMCGMHLQRFIRHGSNSTARVANGTAINTVNEALSSNTDDCIPWTLSVTAFGYGEMRYKNKTTRSHRVVCELYHGTPPFPRADAAHTCGNKLCINPRHIRWATRSENETDKIAHGRSNRGERQGSSKLTEYGVIEIRRLAITGVNPDDLAKTYRVAPRTVRDVLSGATWSWLSA